MKSTLEKYYGTRNSLVDLLAGQEGEAEKSGTEEKIASISLRIDNLSEKLDARLKEIAEIEPVREEIQARPEITELREQKLKYHNFRISIGLRSALEAIENVRLSARSSVPHADKAGMASKILSSISSFNWPEK